MTDPDASAPAGLYVHIPFCSSRCTYCTFVTARFTPARAARYIERLLTELDLLADSLPAPERRIDSLYLGGGTPSLLPVSALAALHQNVHTRFDTAPDTEITLEANPRDVDPGRARAWRQLGITRVSLGAQSSDPELLRRLGRDHGPGDTARAAHTLRESGCANLSLDLIAGLPGQSLARDIDWLLALAPEHVSVYLLELKTGSRLALDVRRGAIALPDDDAVAADYLMLVERLAAAGLRQYEIANFARPISPGSRETHASRHNLKYWRQIPTLAAGLAAHGFDGRERWSNFERLPDYERALARGALPRAAAHRVTTAEAFEDALILGLRLTEGVDLRSIEARFGAGPVARVLRALQPHAEAGLIAPRAAGRMRLTPRGMLLSNEVFAAVLAATDEMPPDPGPPRAGGAGPTDAVLE